MKIGKKLVALCLSATLALGSTFGLAACGGTLFNKNTDDDQIRAVYDLYAANCAETGEEALTYEEWLASIKGAKGDKGDKGAPGEDGLTPHIDAETGNWFIGDDDTGIKAAGTNGTNGSNGTTPHIGTNGNWYIGERDTGIPATGPKGTDGTNGTNGSNGTNGKDGSSFLHGKGAPGADLGKAGDLYLDLNTGDLYEKDTNGWSSEAVGNLKGPKGDKGDKGDSATGGSEHDDAMPSGEVVAEYKNVTIDANDGTYKLDLTDVEAGCYWLVADTDTAVAEGVLTVESTTYYKINPRASRYTTSVTPFDMYSTKGLYKGIVAVDEDTTKQNVTLHNQSEDSITADLKLIKYNPITLEFGKEIEVPCVMNSILGDETGRASLFTNMDALVGRQLNITVTCTPSYYKEPDVRYMTEEKKTSGNIPSNVETENSWPDTDNHDGVWTHTFTVPAEATDLYFANTSGYGCNVIIKIELAEA